MATTSASAEPARMSFAKVAASAGNENAPIKSFARGAVTMPLREFRKDNAQLQRVEAIEGAAQSTSEHSSSTYTTPSTLPQARQIDSTTQDRVAPTSIDGAAELNLIDAVKALAVSSPMPSLVVNGSGSADASRKSYVADGFPEDLFQRADSGSELGTKPPSLDGKSITSGTTFALDEKESLRPDDSASVKAAEDDDTFSGRGSIVAGSRMGSEAAARAYRDYNPSERKPMQPMLERQVPGESTPRSGSSGQQTTDDGKPKIEGAAGAPDLSSLFYRQNPDEKLLEALDSPKDRMFLLRLEQDVIEFVKDSKEPFIDLPPSNSFCRMLTHKLADYYHMTHQVDAGAVLGAVRIFRTPFCRLPAPLTTISNPPTTGNTPPPTAMPTMKIMRRGGDTGPSPSKATSETGSDGKDKSLSAKEKLSREEREAAYNKARERIFGKDGEGGATPETEEGNEMSRSSSVSTKDRAGQNKRSKPKQQRDDDTFDRRSQYTPVFPQPQVQVPTWAPIQYPHMPQQSFNPVVQNGYPSQMVSAQYLQSQQYGQQVMMHTGSMQYTSAVPQYGQQTQQRFPANSAPTSSYASPVQSPQIPQNQWQPQPQQTAVYPPQYQAQAQSAVPRGPPSSVPYAFGQLPSALNSADPKSQHPIPGSFNRHAFNPKTQSFVPGNVGLPVSQPISHHGSPHHGSPHHGSPHLAYNAYAPPQQFSNGMGYNMARQGSNNSVPSYHASPHMPHRPMMPQSISQPQGMPHGLPQVAVHTMGHNMSQQNMHGMSSNGHVSNHLPNYGNSSTLPPKPPTGV